MSKIVDWIFYGLSKFWSAVFLFFGAILLLLNTKHKVGKWVVRAGILCATIFILYACVSGEAVRPYVWNYCTSARGEFVTSDVCGDYTNYVMEQGGFGLMMCVMRQDNGTSSKKSGNNTSFSVAICLEAQGIGLQDYFDTLEKE